MKNATRAMSKEINWLLKYATFKERRVTRLIDTRIITGSNKKKSMRRYFFIIS